MADQVIKMHRPHSAVPVLFRDMGDGTYAEVVTLGGGAPLTTITATIASGAAISAAIDIGNTRMARLALPAGWTTANITFQTSVDGLAFKNLYDIYGTEYTVVAAADRAILIPLADFIGVRHLKIRSGTIGTPVNQGADRILTLQLVAV